MEKEFKEYFQKDFCRLDLGINEERESDEIYMIKRCDTHSKFKLKYYIGSWTTKIPITEELFNKIIAVYRDTVGNFKYTRLRDESKEV